MKLYKHQWHNHMIIVQAETAVEAAKKIAYFFDNSFDTYQANALVNRMHAGNLPIEVSGDMVVIRQSSVDAYKYRDEAEENRLENEVWLREQELLRQTQE